MKKFSKKDISSYLNKTAGASILRLPFRFFLDVLENLSRSVFGRRVEGLVKGATEKGFVSPDEPQNAENFALNDNFNDISRYDSQTGSGNNSFNVARAGFCDVGAQDNENDKNALSDLCFSPKPENSPNASGLHFSRDGHVARKDDETRDAKNVETSENQHGTEILRGTSRKNDNARNFPAASINGKAPKKFQKFGPSKNFSPYKIFSFLSLTAGAAIMLLPFWFMLTLSVSPESAVFDFPPKIFPEHPTIQNFVNICKHVDIGRYFFNSAVVAVLTTIGQVFVSACAGYAFARLDFRFKEPLFVLILLTMTVPPQVNIIPLFFLMRTLHLTDSYAAMILPGLFGGFGVFMMRQYFKTLPADLENAAKIDGCGTFSTFFKIALPLALPAIATLGVFTFITTWNAFMWPLIITSSESMRTLPVGLSELKAGYREIVMWGELCAYCVICSLPVIGAFLLARKFFVNDIASGSVKE
ncbi:MAG: carbohydrate ABC transporter permease [Candidatus Gastranaerophilaceae bacterium]